MRPIRYPANSGLCLSIGPTALFNSLQVIPPLEMPNLPPKRHTIPSFWTSFRQNSFSTSISSPNKTSQALEA